MNPLDLVLWGLAVAAAVLMVGMAAAVVVVLVTTAKNTKGANRG